VTPNVATGREISRAQAVTQASKIGQDTTEKSMLTFLVIVNFPVALFFFRIQSNYEDHTLIFV